MPIFKNYTVVELVRDVKAFLRLELGLIRGNLSDPEQQAEVQAQALSDAKSQIRDQTHQIKQLRKSFPADPTYNNDSLAVWRKDVSFLQEPAFVEAYEIGMDSGHKIGRAKGSNVDIHIEWRVQVVLWAAWHARQLPGSFVECGVNTGIFSLAICNYVDFNSTGKDFFLFDTYEGIPEEQAKEGEKDQVRASELTYEDCYDVACRNFEPFPRAKLVRGKVPDTLNSVDIDEICYLSIDMNIVEPEIAAIEFFWDKLVPGAPVLLDDYGWLPHALQKEAMDRFASEKGVKILNIPTGQGLLLKP
jgi:hypothetical protein